MAIGRDIGELCERLGYHFKDISYLEASLTHLSYTNEQRRRGINVKSNERLEFLGDSVLGLVISEWLYGSFPSHREGSLTKMRQSIVCEGTLARIANRLTLGEYLNLGHGEESAGGRARPKILADALEALVAAVYLDAGGLGDVREVILSLFAEELGAVQKSKMADYKTRLQQIADANGALLEYRTVEQSGPEHDRQFTVVALVNNNEVGRGSASRIQRAEMEAAKRALRLFGEIV